MDISRSMPQSQPSRRRRFRLVWVGLLTGLGVVIAGFYIFVLAANLATRDELPSTDSSLVLPDVQVNDVDNAYVDLQKIEAAQAFSSEPDTALADAVSSDTWDEAYVTNTISQHAAAIAWFREAAGKSVYQNPLFAQPALYRWDQAAFPGLTTYRKAAQVTALEAIRRAKSGRVAEGLDEAVAVVRLGHLLESGQNSLIEYLVGSAIKQTGLTAVRRIALTVKIDAAQALRSASAVEAYRDSQTGLVNTMKIEALGMQPWPTDLRQLAGAYNLYSAADGAAVQPSAWQRFSDELGLLPVTGNILTRSLAALLWAPLVLTEQTRFYYQPQATLNAARADVRDRVRLANIDCRQMTADPPLRTYLPRAGLSLLFTRNAVGRGVLSNGQVSYGSLLTKRCDESVAVSATQAVLGLSAYAGARAALPASLAELVPAYLNAAPPDPYSGQTLRYNPATKRLYSVGVDHQDSGGNPDRKITDTADPTFAIP